MTVAGGLNNQTLAEAGAEANLGAHLLTLTSEDVGS